MKFKIISNVNQKEWNEYLQLSDYSTFFQTAEFLLKKNSERYPLFIYIYNDFDEIQAQLGMMISKSKSGYSTKILKKLVNLSSKIGGRGSWVSGPIIHSNDESIRTEILSTLFSALDKIDFDNDTTIEGSKTAVGTLANCSGHITPWNTVLTCEENYDMFYGERNRKDGKIIYPSYTLGWEKHFAFPPEHYGWVVEIDPFSNKKRKLISLGRCAHECAHLKELEDGRLVVYTGDDIDNGCIYKFVSNSPKDLTNGVLYVASLEQKKWIPVEYDKHSILQEKFNSQLEVLTYLREASRLIGGSQLDRPEDIDIDPLEQGVFIALTNNFAKNNFHGSILKITEKDNKHDSEEFDFEHLISGGEETGFSCPDNLIFDKVGNLWFTSDITGSRLNKSPYEKFGNNGLFVLIRNGDQAGKIIQVASAPVEAEFTGPCFSPDWKTLFLSVQHPGERSVSLRNVSSKWPKEKGGPKPAVVSISGNFLKDIMT